MNGSTITLIILAAIALYAIYTYNGLVKARQMVKEAWSGIDVQLKRRADLIPNLVETVKGYASHESETLSNVTEMRPARKLCQRVILLAAPLQKACWGRLSVV